MNKLSDILAILVRPFAPAEIKSRPGRGGLKFSYVDARVVGIRLDEAFGPFGWSFTVAVVDLAAAVVKGTLTVTFPADETNPARVVVREDFGYPNNPDDPEAEGLKSASSDALKRCAVQLGIGRHLYGAVVPAPRQARAADPDLAPVDPVVEITSDQGRRITNLVAALRDAGNEGATLVGLERKAGKEMADWSADEADATIAKLERLLAKAATPAAELE